MTRLRVQTFGVSTEAWQYGAEQGSTIVFVHGFRGDHHGLEQLARALCIQAPELRVIVPDLPGFGQSEAIPGREHNLDLYGEWLCQFIAEMGLGDGEFAILGHSFGSLVVANALARGLQPNSTMLINPISAPALEGPKALMTKLAICYYEVADRLPGRAARALLGNPVIVRVMSMFMAKTSDSSRRAWIHDQHDRYFSQFADSRTLLQAFRASVSHTVTQYAAYFTGDTLLIAGDRDDITPVSDQLALARRIKSSRLQIIQGTGHLIHYEAVEEATLMMSGFLRAGQSR